MNKLKLACLIACLALCLAIFSGLVNPQAIVKAEDGQASPPEEKIELNTKYPIRPGPSDTTFEFEVELSYLGGEELRTFELSATGPTGWATRIQQSTYETKEVSAIRLDPVKLYPETVVVVAMAPFWLFPEPGDYTIKLEAAAGEIKGSIDLTARITARYGFTAETASGRLNIKATAGKESSPFSIIIINTGTATLDKITFSSTKPVGIGSEEWGVTFKPDKIEALEPSDKQEVKVSIRPPAKTIAGDYMTTLRFDSDPKPSAVPPKLEIRVAVGTSTKWGWIGAGIVIAVIAGLVVGFRQLGRR